MMEEGLTLGAALAAITPAVYFVIDRIKVQLPQRTQRWLPEIAALLGIVGSASALYITGPYGQDVWLLTCIAGMNAGLGAVGYHQSKKTKEV